MLILLLGNKASRDVLKTAPWRPHAGPPIFFLKRPVLARNPDFIYNLANFGFSDSGQTASAPFQLKIHYNLWPPLTLPLKRAVSGPLA